MLAALFLAPATESCSSLSPEDGKLVVGCVDKDSDPSTSVSFANDIRPLMNRQPDDPTGLGCIKCHYETQPQHACYDQTGLDLSSLGGLRQGGITTGTSIVIPGKPCESGLVQKLLGDYPVGIRMPKGGPPYWTPGEIQLVIDWIAEGAQGSPKE